ncbi:MAG TPA: hypothetical protein VHX38_09150 [Pseudonocardiaceae bacterium]|nr:hypothetical protein [Pseudonocardiaceae bacterium]
MSSDERRRVIDGPHPGEQPTAQLVAADVRCDGDAPTVLGRCREAMAAVLEHADGRWRSDEQWRELLPAWFVAVSAPDKTPEQIREHWARREAMTPEQRRALDAEQDQRWSVGGWVSNFDPGEREWAWWSAEVIGSDQFRVLILADTWPVPVGPLDWLLRAAGGREIEIDI